MDTWIKLGNEIVRLVLPHRGHTVNLILLLTVPTSVIAGVFVTAAVLVPHPPLALGVAASSVAVYGLVRIRLRRLFQPIPTAVGRSDKESEDPASLPPP